MTNLLNVLKTSLAQEKVPVRSTVLPRTEAKDGALAQAAEPDLPDDTNALLKQLIQAQLKHTETLKLPITPTYDDQDRIVSVTRGVTAAPIEYDLPDETETDDDEDDDDAQFQSDLTL